MRTFLLAPALLVPALAVVAVAVAPVPDAAAKPEYAKKEGKECAFCHVNPKGGGPRNAKGDEYAKNGHKFATTGAAAGPAKGFGEDNAFKTETNAKQYGFLLAAIQLEHWSDALKKISEGDKNGAIALIQDLLKKAPECKVAAPARQRLEELTKDSGAMPAMGG